MELNLNYIRFIQIKLILTYKQISDLVCWDISVIYEKKNEAGKGINENDWIGVKEEAFLNSIILEDLSWAETSVWGGS